MQKVNTVSFILKSVIKGMLKNKTFSDHVWSIAMEKNGLCV